MYRFLIKSAGNESQEKQHQLEQESTHSPISEHIVTIPPGTQAISFDFREVQSAEENTGDVSVSFNEFRVC